MAMQPDYPKKPFTDERQHPVLLMQWLAARSCR